MSTDFYRKDGCNWIKWKEEGGGGEEKNKAMTGYILIVTYLPLYRLLGALLHPPTPSLRNHFHAKKKNMLAPAIYFYVWEVIIIVRLP
jgi:hypothetical protein